MAGAHTVDSVVHLLSHKVIMIAMFWVPSLCQRLCQARDKHHFTGFSPPSSKEGGIVITILQWTRGSESFRDLC